MLTQDQKTLFDKLLDEFLSKNMLLIKNDLIDQIRKDIKDRGWNKAYSRNLVVSGISMEGPIYYGDHTGNSLERVCHAQVRNRRNDAAALQAVCILDAIANSSGTELPWIGDRTPLKWAGLSHAYGIYKFHYKIFSNGLPILRFIVDVNLRWSAALPLEWQEQSTASLAV